MRTTVTVLGRANVVSPVPLREKDGFVGVVLGAVVLLRQSDGAKTQVPVSGPPPPQAARTVDASRAMISLRMSGPMGRFG